jgi:hypothetical protein
LGLEKAFNALKTFQKPSKEHLPKIRKNALNPYQNPKTGNFKNLQNCFKISPLIFLRFP